MMRSIMWKNAVTKDSRWKAFFISSLFLILVTITGLLLGEFGISTPYLWALVVGAVSIAVIILLRQDELAVVLIIAVSIYLDWFSQKLILALFIALGFLLVFSLFRSPQHPWIAPRALWLWLLFLVLAILPAVRGATNSFDALFYYPHIILGALIMFWLGTVVARDRACVRCLFKLLAGFVTLLAIHTIIEATTGVALFSNASYSAYLADVSANYLSGPDVHRAGSFLLNPDWNGAFFAMMLFIPLCLFVESSFVVGRLLYLIEAFIMLLALLFTYTTGAWIAASVGLLAFMVLVGHARYRILILLFIFIGILVIIAFFPSQLALLLQHSTSPDELRLRNGAWQTALRVIQAFPLTGIGLSLEGYLRLAEPYRVPAQYIPLGHPHNSYLELGAMAGLPVLIVFMALLLFALWLALRNWVVADARMRFLLAGGIAAVIVLSVNSLSVNGWTLPPLAAVGWLILGAISSPLLTKSLASAKELKWRMKDEGISITS